MQRNKKDSKLVKAYLLQEIDTALIQAKEIGYAVIKTWKIRKVFGDIIKRKQKFLFHFEDVIGNQEAYNLKFIQTKEETVLITSLIHYGRGSL